MLEMADNLKSGLSEVIYIGDSEVDIKTGQAAGVKTILVSWGFRSTEDLIKAGAEQIVDSVQEIFEITKEESDE